MLAIYGNKMLLTKNARYLLLYKMRHKSTILDNPLSRNGNF